MSGRVVRDAAAVPSVWALVVTAAGDEHFPVGMDLKDLMDSAGRGQALDMILTGVHGRVADRRRTRRRLMRVILSLS